MVVSKPPSRAAGIKLPGGLVAVRAASTFKTIRLVRTNSASLAPPPEGPITTSAYLKLQQSLIPIYFKLFHSAQAVPDIRRRLYPAILQRPLCDRHNHTTHQTRWFRLPSQSSTRSSRPSMRAAASRYDFRASCAPPAQDFLLTSLLRVAKGCASYAEPGTRPTTSSQPPVLLFSLLILRYSSRKTQTHGFWSIRSSRRPHTHKLSVSFCPLSRCSEPKANFCRPWITSARQRYSDKMEGPPKRAVSGNPQLRRQLHHPVLFLRRVAQGSEDSPQQAQPRPCLHIETGMAAQLANVHQRDCLLLPHQLAHLREQHVHIKTPVRGGLRLFRRCHDFRKDEGA